MAEFTVHDDVVTARAAASKFFWRSVSPRLPWLAAGAVLLSAMTIATYYRIYRIPDDWVLKDIYSVMLVINSLLLLINLLYVPVLLGMYRVIAVGRVRRDPVRHVRMTDTEISVTSSQLSAAVPWSRFRDLTEYPDFFILSYTRSIYWWLPRKEMSGEALKLIRNAAGKLRR